MKGHFVLVQLCGAIGVKVCTCEPKEREREKRAILAIKSCGISVVRERTKWQVSRSQMPLFNLVKRAGIRSA